MKFNLIILPVLSFLILNFVQAQDNEAHHCSINKIKTFQTAKTSGHKSISGQEKYDLNYVKLDLTLDNLSTNIDIGHATLKAKVVALSLDILILELQEDIVLDSAKINGDIVAFNRVDDELQLFPINNLAQNTDFIAEVFYHGAALNNGGFVNGIFNDVSPSWGANVTWTLSESFNAYTWWPCKQDLNDKIDSSEVWLTVPDTLKAGSNGLLLNEVPLANNKTRFEWKHKHPIDYYLISLAVGPYVDYSFNAALPGIPDSVLVQNYIYDNPNTLINFLTEINKTGDMLYKFSEMYGIYPFYNEKYGHCMAPLSGGMEHQTMTTQGFFEQGLTAHELGHQWFGDNVTCQTWGHIWVNEGFASYSEYLYQQTLNQSNAQQDMEDVHNNVMRVLGGSVFVTDDTDENRIFDSRLTYDKGSALVHMIRHWVNNDALFFNALKVFQTTYTGGTATAEDLINIVEDETSVDFSDFLNHWYYGEGYPTYSGVFNDYNGQVLIELNQSSSVPNTNPFFTSFIDIKINFINGSDTIIRVKNSINNQQYTFNIDKEIYAVSVDPDNWVLNKAGSFIKNDDFTEAINVVSGIRSEEKLNLAIYPNPNHDFFNLENKELDGGQLNIINDLGQLVFQQEINSGMNIIHHNLPEGVYFVTVQLSSFMFYEKLLIQ